MTEQSEESKSFLGTLRTDRDVRWRVIKTMCITLTGIELGTLFGHLGPALPDIKRLLDSDLETVSWLFTATSCGYLIGALTSGAIYDRCRPMLALYLSALSGAVLTAALPWCPNLWSMIILRVFTGIACGALDTGQITCVSSIWRSKVRPYMHILQLAVSFGGIITPLIIEPFLGEKGAIRETQEGFIYNQNGTYEGFIYDTSQDFYNTNISGQNEEKIQSNRSNISIYSVTENPQYFSSRADTRLHYAFIILGVIGFCSSLSLLYFVFNEGKENKASEQHGVDKDIDLSTSHEPRISMVVTVTLLALLSGQIFLYATMFFKIISFLSAYCIMQFDWSPSDASKGNAVFWGCFSLARMVGIYLVSRFRPNPVILCFYILAIVSAVLFTVVGVFHLDHVAWACIGFLGISLSIQFPSIFTWTEENFRPVTGKITSLFLFSLQTAGMIEPIYSSYLMEEFSPLWFAYLMVVQSVLAIVLYCIALVVKRKFVPKVSLTIQIGASGETDEELEIS